MSNKERLDNFIKIDLTLTESLQQLYHNQISRKVVDYENWLHLKSFKTRAENKKFLDDKFNEIKIELETAFESEKKEPIAKLYNLHINLIALEHLLNRLDYI